MAGGACAELFRSAGNRVQAIRWIALLFTLDRLHPTRSSSQTGRLPACSGANESIGYLANVRWLDSRAGMRICTHMRKNTHISEALEFSRRERQIMDILYSAGEASAREIWQRMPQAPTYSTVRTLLAVLEDKRHIVRRLEGKAFVYRPRQQRATVAIAALRRTLKTFFQGSVEQVVSGLLEMEDKSLTNAELKRIAKMISEARKEKK